MSKPLAKHLIIAVEKVDGSDEFIPIGCMTGLEDNSTVETTTINCRSGKSVEPSDDPELDWSFPGVRHLGQGATEVSYNDLKAWHRGLIKKKFQIIDGTLVGTVITPTVGGYKETALCVITSCNRSAGETGQQTYNISLKPDNSTYVIATITA